MPWTIQNFDVADFAENYWQKKPGLFRQVFKDFESPVSPEELAGLACEETVHSRIVLESAGISPWELRYGPFQESDFTSLPETHYSLLVSECEKWIPEFSDLLDQFRFIPDWRIDDLMVSYASAGGSVGPHLDEYDVFLLQSQGQRKWSYTSGRVDNPALLPDLDLAILCDFFPEHEAVLGPGDMLYLPPGVAHHGVALGPCMTCSIGFRAPKASEVLDSLVLELDRNEFGQNRYSDPDLELNRGFGEITPTEIEKIKSLAIDLIDQADELWPIAIGKLLSDSALRDTEEILPPKNLNDMMEFNWLKHVDSKMLYLQSTVTIQFFCNGLCFELPNSGDNLNMLRYLCENGKMNTEFLHNCLENKPFTGLILQLAGNGSILRDDEP